MADVTESPVYPKVSPQKIHIIINPASGQDQPFLQAMNTAFAEAKIEWDIFLTKKAGDAQRLAREAVESGAEVVAAYGGDGTVGEVAAGLIGSDVPLAIFPGGTANVMSVELGIPGDLAGAIALVCGGGVARPVDMAKSGDHTFLLRTAIGYTAEMTKGASREEKNRLGNLAYVLSALRALPEAAPVPYHLTLDGEQVDIEGAVCLVANSGSLGLPGWSLTKKIDVSDGLLDVVLIQQVNIGSLLEVAANALGVREPLNHWQVKEVSVKTDVPQTVECDGEIIEPTPLTASIIPQAIRVIVPEVTAAPAPPEA